MKKGIKQLLTISLIILAIVAITIPVKAATNNLKENVESGSNKDTYQIKDGTIVIGKSKFTPGVVVTGEKAAIAGANDLAIYLSENNNKSIKDYTYPKMYTYTFGEWYEYVNGKATKKVNKKSLEIWYINNVLKQGLSAPSLVETTQPATKYSVLFVSSEENKVLDQRQVEENKQVGTAPKAIRTGYELVGWIKATVGSDTTTEVALDKVASEKITADTIFFAKWSEVTKFSVSLDEVGKSKKNNNALLEAVKGLGYEGNYDTAGKDKLTLSANGKLSGLIEITPDENIPDTTFSGDRKTGYYFAYVLDVEGTVTEATTVTLKGNGEEKTLPFSAFDDVANGKMVILVSLNKNASDKTTSVVVDLDGSGNKYTAKTYTIDWSGVTFQEPSKATFTSQAEELPQADVDYISSNWGYTRTAQDTYELKADESDPLKLKLTETVVKQTVKSEAGFGKTEGYFFLYNINDDSFIPNKTTVKGPKSNKTVTDGTGVTFLFDLNKDANTKTFTVKVDLDGAGDEYTEVEYTIDYSEVKFSEISKANIATQEKDVASEVIKESLQKSFKWSRPEGWDVKFVPEKNGTDETKLKVDVSGILPIVKNVTGFSTDETTNYYLPIVIKSAVKPTEATQLTIPALKAENGVKVVTGKDVWDKKDDDSGDNEIVILMSLKPQEGAVTKTFDIVVDMDGEGTNYVPYTVTIDYTNLKFQQVSEAEVKLTAKDEVDAEFTGWGYKPETNQNLTLTNGVLKGKLIEQQLSSAEAFGDGKQDGYYFDFKIELPDDIDTEKVTITRLENKDGSTKKEFTKDDLDDNGDLPILFRFDKTKTGCATCSGSEASCNCCKSEATVECDCEEYKLYYKVDFDGNGNEYLPQDYVIDYCGLTFEKSSKVEALDLGEVSNAEGEEWKGWKEGEKYKTEFKEDEHDSSTVHVTGLIPIFNDKEWADEQDPFEGVDAAEYYLAFKLKKAGTDDTGDSSTIVKFLHGEGNGEEEKITKEDFGENNEIYVLKYLNPRAYKSEKKFKITVDFDNEGEAYAPYTLTIDWSELDFQFNSLYTQTLVGNATDQKGEEDNGYISSEDKETIEGWGYKFENAGNELKIEGGTALTGEVKEQKNVNAGFKDKDGYYVVLKIYGPSDDQAEGNHFLTSNPENMKKWTVQLKDEDGRYMNPVTPSQEDYENGFITVLFKLKEDEDQKLTYRIDFDGAGDYFLPFEETINYDGLEFLKAREVKFSGSNETVTVWDGEEETLKDKIKEQIQNVEPDANPKYNATYYTFEYWTKDDGTKVDDTTPVEDLLDQTLEPHYNLNSDKFVGDIIDDLNEAKGTEQGSHSQDFHEKLLFDKEDLENGNVKIKIVNPETTLSEMNETSIPGAIAYALGKDEIKEITFKVDENNKTTFDKNGVKATNGIMLAEELPLKEQVKAGLQALYKKVLGDEANDTEVTLSSMVSKHPSFEISIDDYDKNKITLSKTKYIFTFESSVAVVSTEEQLKEALKNINITDILVKEGFKLVDVNQDAKNSHTLVIDLTQANRNLTIKSLNSQEPVTISDDEKTEEGETDTTPVIEVKAGNVTFEDIKIKGATRAITVDSGATVTAKNVTAIGSQDTGFDVKEGATFTGINLQYKDLEGSNDKESYHYPTVCGKGKVILQKTTEAGEVTDANATKVTDYKRIVHATTGKFTDADFKNPETGEYYSDFLDENGSLKEVYQNMIKNGTKNPPDFLSSTGHTHYYLDSENSVYYTFHFRDSRINLIIFKYYAKGDTITPPVNQSYMEENESLYFFIKAQVKNKDGQQKTYVHDGWSKTEHDDEYGANSLSQKVDSFEFPANPETIQNYYTHFSEGYRVIIPIEVNGTDKTGIFGILKPEADSQVTIQNLMDKDEEFKKAFEALKKKATEAGKAIINGKDTTKEINEQTPITENMDLKIETLQQDSLISFEGPSANGLSTTGNKVSGILSTQSEDKKYYIPLTLTSDNFQDNVSKVKVTDPNGNEKTYTYSSASENKIATVSTAKTMNLQLEAIKASNIKSGQKVYKIAIDVDGENANNYAVKNITLDYSGVKTLEEKINKAAENTLNANSFTVTKDNYINYYPEKFTYEYNKEQGLTHLVSNKGDNVEEYTFSIKYAGIKDENRTASVVVSKNRTPAKVQEKITEDGKVYKAQDGSIYINDWIYEHPQQVGSAIHEVKMLIDVMKDSHVYNAIDGVKEVEGKDHTYTVTLNSYKYNQWVNDSYLSNPDYTFKEFTKDNKLEVQVELDEDENYVKSIKTTEANVINKFDVTFEKVNATTIAEPTSFLAKENDVLTEDDIIKFYEAGKQWWSKHTGSQPAE